MSLADRIKVKTCYTRSTNVERDSGAVATIAAYHPTTRGVALLEDVAAAFGKGNQPRAWSLIGPYGAGKSTFGVFLHALLGGKDCAATEAAKILGKQSRRLATRFRRQKPWCRVVLTGSPEPLSRRLLTALDAAASAFWQGRPGGRPRVLKDIHDAATQKTVPERHILALIDALQDALERIGAGGLLFVIDELGKFLEFEARQPTGHMGSTYLMQELAERTYLGRKANLMLFVLHHQAFDMHAPGMGDLQNEWAKVQGRFQTVSFIETTEQTLRVLSDAFEHDLTEQERNAIWQRSTQCATALADANALPLGLEASAATELFTACYPMHPVALLALPILCVRFAQNERTLFGYFGSQEPNGFQNAVKRLERFGERVPPAGVYDYFIEAQPPSFATPLAQRTWAEVVTAVDGAAREEEKRTAGTGDQKADLVAIAKTVGLLNLTTGNEAIPASEAVLRQLDTPDDLLQQTIAASMDASILQYRKFADEYRVWQGTDFNIDEHIARERDKLGRIDLASVMTERGETAPIVARRHSIETGALRTFEIIYADAEHRAPSEGRGLKPRLVFFLAESRADEATFHEARKSAQTGEVWVLHRGGTGLRTAIVQVLVMARVRDRLPAIEADAVAVREVETYCRKAKVAERQALSTLFGDPSASSWYWKEQQFDIPDRRTLQSVLSDIMDEVYWASAKVRQELINRDNLSPQAVAARNKLLQCMFDGADHAALGIPGYPSERAVYHAVLEKGELHGQDEAGKWVFQRPSASDPLNLGPTLQRLDALFEASETDPVSAQQLMGDLAAAPFGVKPGLFWILLLHYYLLNRNEIVFFDEHGYSPTLTYETMRRMLARPAHATFRHFRSQGTRTLFDEYGNALFGRSRDSLSALDIARPLIRFVFGLDDYSLKTKRVSETAARVRQAIRTSKSAQQLVFHDLGNACGLGEDAEPAELASTVAQALRELANVRPTLLDDMRTAVGACFSAVVGADLHELRDAARSQCKELPQYRCDDGFKHFIAAAGAKGKPDDEWFEDLLTVLGDGPSTAWEDGAETVVKAKLAVYAESLRDWQLLKSSEDALAAGQDEAVELVLLSIKRTGRGAVRVVVPCATAPSKQFVELADAVKKVVESVDEKHRLALLASVVDDRIGDTENVH